MLISRIIDQAKTTALDMTNNVELRARNAGVPVDQYKKQAGEIASDLQKRVQEATGYVQDQAGKAKKQGVSSSVFNVRDDKLIDSWRDCRRGSEARYVPR